MLNFARNVTMLKFGANWWNRSLYIHTDQVISLPSLENFCVSLMILRSCVRRGS